MLEGWYGKIIGAFLGYLIGRGLLGAIIGFILGHQYDVATARRRRELGSGADGAAQITGDPNALRPYAVFQEALAQLVPAEYARVRLEGPDRPPAWTDLLGWLARDQRCRYTHHAHWRHPDAETGVAALSRKCAADQGLAAPAQDRLIQAAAALTAMAAPCFSPICSRQSRRERSALTPAPKEQPPRKLSGKRTA